jgi:hypothetical protein
VCRINSSYSCNSDGERRGGGAAPFVGHEFLEGDNEKRAEPALFAVGGIQSAFFQPSAEIFLREILGVMRGFTGTADEGIERIPVFAADSSQSGSGFRGGLPRGSDDRPARIGKDGLRRAGRRWRVHAKIILRLFKGNEAVVTDGGVDQTL